MIRYRNPLHAKLALQFAEHTGADLDWHALETTDKVHLELTEKQADDLAFFLMQSWHFQGAKDLMTILNQALDHSLKVTNG